MAKTCPSCGYRPIGPFTDNCPICAEPVRNVRTDGGGFGGFGGSTSLIKWIAIGTAVAVLGVGGCCGLGMWRMGNVFKDAQQQMERMQAEQEADRRARTVVVTAAEVLKDFQADAGLADEKYEGKYLEITGVVERSGRGRYEQPFVVLTAGDETAKLKIECFLLVTDPRDEARIKRLAKGQTITVRGEYDGRVSNVQLRDGVLVK